MIKFIALPQELLFESTTIPLLLPPPLPLLLSLLLDDTLTRYIAVAIRHVSLPHS